MKLCTRRAAGVLRRGCSLAWHTTTLRLNTIVLPSGASGLSMCLFASGGAGAAGCVLEQMYRLRFKPCYHRARVRSFAHCCACAQSDTDGTFTRCTIARRTTTHTHIHTSPLMSCCAHPSSRTRGALVCASASYVGRRVADRVARTQGRSLRSIARSHDTPRSTLRSHDAQPIARRSTNRTTLNQSATNQVSQAMRAMPHPIGAAQRSHARGL